MHRRIRIGSADSVPPSPLDTAVSSSQTTPPVHARYSHVLRRGLHPNGPQPYYHGGKVYEPWQDEDELTPGARALFYTTAGDLFETPDGTVHYDGEDDGAAKAAVDFYRQTQAGVDATGALKPGTGGKRAVSLAEKLGIKTRWVKHELMPGVQLRVKRGTKVAVANTGTTTAPVFMVTPGVKVEGAWTGVIPLVVALVKGGASAAAKTAARRAEQRKGQHLAPGQSIEVGALGEGELSENVSEGAESACIMCGALLIDSDGRKVRI